MISEREKKILLTAYKEIYKTEFVPHQHGEKLKMHKAIYLLKELGTVCGDFNFFWHISGPYSHNLHKNLLEIESRCSVDEIHEYSNGCVFTAKAEDAIKKLRDIFSEAEKYGYNSMDWCEVLGSIHFIKKHKCSYENSDEKVIEILEHEKPNLGNHSSNLQALKLLKESSFL